MDPTNLFPAILFGALSIGCSVVHLCACYRRWPKIRRVTKALLMPLLCAVYVFAAPQVRLLVVAALLFGWLGDLFLMFQQRTVLMLCGVCAFALGHIFYMGALLSAHPVLNIMILIPLALCVIWMTFVVKKLIPYAPRQLKKPGFLYALLLSGTCLSALYMLLITQKLAYLIAFVGGLFFVLSDTILTGQKYRRETRHGNFYVMLTYIIAQDLLILGLALSGGN
ncbi:MAG: lysoplasmalogenase [Clostridia bacterium]|nr:lysoplasmalogenase [Clostridia bacterium]